MRGNSDNGEMGKKGRGGVEVAKVGSGVPAFLTTLLTTKEVAALLRVKESTVRHWVCTGALPNVKFPGAVRYRVDAIQSWIDSASRDGHGKPVSEVARDVAGEIYASPGGSGSKPRRGRRPAGRPGAVPSTIKREGSVA
jgi:excisionase family DNA binding protein